MLRVVLSVVVSLSALVLLTGTALAQESACADCHFANPQWDPNPRHLSDWERSAHGRNQVGCEKCHQGDASTFETFLAHRGVLTSGNPSSPVHRANLPRTCGACHTGAFVAFQRSAHYGLLGEGRDEGPTCSTCHGTVAAELFSPRRLEQRCQGCHAEDGVRPMPEAGLEARVLLEEVGNVRRLLREAADLIRRVDDAEERRELEEAYQQAEVPLTEAVQNAHAFVFDRMRERLRTSRERAETLLNGLANPAP